MKKILSLFCLIATTCLTSSCSIFRNNINNEQTYLSLEIFQTLSKYEALAHTNDYDYKVVKVVTSEETYYDGKSLSGTFVLVDTYTYETKDERIKTVPVYRRKSELKR